MYFISVKKKENVPKSALSKDKDEKKLLNWRNRNICLKQVIAI